jgi:type IV pilus assembly protein PilB
MRTICPRCRQVHKPGAEELGRLAERTGGRGKPRLFRGAGCRSCYQTGYEGRKAIFEILPVSPKIRGMIVDGCDDEELKEQAMAEGMRTLRRNAVDEVLRGTTTVDELMRVVDLKRE